MKRSGFTLLEITIVISVLVVLVAMLLPAIQSARATAQVSAVTMELNQFSTAIEAFRSTYGAYPPSSITIHVDAAGWQSDPASLAKVLRLFPNFDMHAPPTAYKWTAAKSLTGAECLVFWLGGITYLDTRDVSGRITQFGQPMGFSSNPAQPFAPSTGNDSRNVPFIKFAIDRFCDVDGDECPEYRDSLPNQSAPIVYALSDGQGFNVGDLVVGTTSDLQLPYQSLGDATQPVTARAGLNRATFQLVSPGRDGQYGFGGPWGEGKGVAEWVAPDVYWTDKVAGRAARLPERDNIANFSGGLLQK